MTFLMVFPSVATMISPSPIPVRRDDDLPFAVDLPREYDVVALAQIDAAHARRNAALRGNVVLVRVQAHAARRYEEQRRSRLGVVLLDADDLVALVDLDRLECVFEDVVLLPIALFDVAELGIE